MGDAFQGMTSYPISASDRPMEGRLRNDARKARRDGRRIRRPTFLKKKSRSRIIPGRLFSYHGGEGRPVTRRLPPPASLKENAEHAAFRVDALEPYVSPVLPGRNSPFTRNVFETTA